MIPLLSFLMLAALLALAGPARLAVAPQALGVPALVFVSRQPAPGAPDSVVPGLGPRGRAIATGGRLLVRRANGRIDPLLPEGAFFDVSDPTVSWDGRRVAFAATPAPDSAWRIYVVGADGRGLAAVTRSDRVLDLAPLGEAAARFRRYDDLDPCWLPDGRLCFASTRYPQRAEIGGQRVTNLFVVNADGSHLERITSERNGAEEPTVDPRTGRIVYARWWFNRYRPSDLDPSGITTDPARALPADSVNLWQAVSITPDGDRLRLAGGNPRVRAQTEAYQPVVLEDGTLIGVHAARTAIYPQGGRLTLQSFRGGFAAPARLPEEGSGHWACSPAALPDGRVVFSYDPRGDGDFGLYVTDADGRRLERVVDLPGSLELDAAVLAARRRPPIVRPSLMALPRALPAMSVRDLHDRVTTFRFDCLNVFANAAVDVPIPDAPPLGQGLRIRFYAALSRPERASGDTVVLLREAPVDKSGAVHQTDLPADVPMFEQLVDAHGRVVRSASGPAHVPGFNAGRFGFGTKCVGCHIGHSTIPVAVSAQMGKRFNASPSAEVWASSSAPGTAGPRAAVDRRTRGPATQVDWISDSTGDQRLRLTWRSPIEVDAVVLYAISPHYSEGTNLRVEECEVTLLRGGRVVRRSVIRAALSPSGTRIECEGERVDGLEVRPTRVTGRVRHRAAVALAEIETIARLPED